MPSADLGTSFLSTGQILRMSIIVTIAQIFRAAVPPLPKCVTLNDVRNSDRWPISSRSETIMMCYRFCMMLALLWGAIGQVLADRPPNIVLILGDDQAWTDYGFMGHPLIQTPRLDDLAARSAVFPLGYVPTALCRPSLATIVSGLYAHQHRLTGNDPSAVDIPPSSSDSRLATESYSRKREELIGLLDRVPTLPKLLFQKGYRSFQSGKWWEGSFARGGFTQGMTRGFPDDPKNGRHGDAGLTIGREGLGPIEAFVDQCIEAQKPFFVWYAPFLPHTPHDPPQRLLDRYQSQIESIHLARYYANCERFDETVGELLDMLDRRNLTNDTMIVYLADNGWIQRSDSVGFAPRSKQSPYEAGVRQPILFSYPGKIMPGTRTDRVSSIDLLPTLCDALQIDGPQGLPGISLWMNLANKIPIPERPIFGEGFAHDVNDIDDPESSLLYRWVVDGPWKLILSYDGRMGRLSEVHQTMLQGPQLFRLDADPHESSNLANAHPDVVKELASKIDRWWTIHRSSLRKEPP